MARSGPGLEPVTLAPDRIPWDIRPLPDRVVAVGDVHGNLGALASILLDRGLIDKRGRWTGSDCHLVLVGDIMHKHEDSRLLMEFLLRLETESRLEGGEVHCLLGNRDVPVGSHRGDLSPLDRFYRPWSSTRSMREEFPAMSRYASWLRVRNALVRIGTTLFVHAGIGRWARWHDPGEINAIIRSWISHWHGLTPRPDPLTGWTVGGSHEFLGPFRRCGPLWTRNFRPRDQGRGFSSISPLVIHEVEEYLHDFRVERMVIGHNPVVGKELMVSHPCYGPLVCSIDTGNFRRSGQLSCLELAGGEVTPHIIRSRKMASKVVKAERRRMKQSEWIRVGWPSQPFRERGQSGDGPFHHPQSCSIAFEASQLFPFPMDWPDSMLVES